MQERLKKIRGLTAVERVRVQPRDDDMRRVLKHPSAGGFRPQGSIEWPLDQFTKRRLRAGSITLEGKADTEKRAQSREQSRVAAAARTPSAT